MSRVSRVWVMLQRPQRTLVLPSLAIAAGLVAAGFGLFRAAPKPLLVVDRKSTR